jgi:D-tyrosyl-tRNA(Tyr) deacylase
VGEEIVGAIGPGLLVLLGVGQEDNEAGADYLADKIVGLRIFEDDGGKMNKAVAEIGGSMLVVSSSRSMEMFGAASGRRLMMLLHRKKPARFTNTLLSASTLRDSGVKPESFKR